MKPSAELVQLFRKRGLRVTPQRRAIFDLLAGEEGHPTAEDIFRRVSAVMPDVSRTTVYNTIHELLEMGELAEVEEVSAGGTRYDTRTAPHHHLACLGCHAVVDIPRDFAGLELAPEEKAGYQVLKRQVTFYGYCPKCLRERKRKKHNDPGGGADPS